MAIIIEGISKGPIKGHDAQLLLHGDGIVMEKFNGVYQTLGAEWKEIPDSHGDLCDKTFLNTMIENADWSDKEALADYIIDLVYDAEVIVEANYGTDS